MIRKLFKQLIKPLSIFLLLTFDVRKILIVLSYFPFDHINITKSNRLTDSIPPVVQPSTCFKNLLLNLKVESAASFTNNLLKDESNYKSCVFYKGDFFVDSCYVGETKRNTEVRCN